MIDTYIQDAASAMRAIGGWPGVTRDEIPMITRGINAYQEEGTEGSNFESVMNPDINRFSSDIINVILQSFERGDNLSPYTLILTPESSLIHAMFLRDMINDTEGSIGIYHTSYDALKRTMQALFESLDDQKLDRLFHYLHAAPKYVSKSILKSTDLGFNIMELCHFDPDLFANDEEVGFAFDTFSDAVRRGMSGIDVAALFAYGNRDAISHPHLDNAIAAMYSGMNHVSAYNIFIRPEFSRERLDVQPICEYFNQGNSADKIIQIINKDGIGEIIQLLKVTKIANMPKSIDYARDAILVVDDSSTEASESMDALKRIHKLMELVISDPDQFASVISVLNDEDDLANANPVTHDAASEPTGRIVDPIDHISAPVKEPVMYDLHMVGFRGDMKVFPVGQSVDNSKLLGKVTIDDLSVIVKEIRSIEGPCGFTCIDRKPHAVNPSGDLKTEIFLPTKKKSDVIAYLESVIEGQELDTSNNHGVLNNG